MHVFFAKTVEVKTQSHFFPVIKQPYKETSTEITKQCRKCSTDGNPLLVESGNGCFTPESLKIYSFVTTLSCKRKLPLLQSSRSGIRNL
ncbi:hypothetical protein CDAR_579791 [Caerostris darwini]|uniref:Uncharacterized protein n=1 Tax=Caerostris darwini TaxID=1538125 RepID=A0AAV4PTV4_9ARAC|nr:hypothetical protein CDAR_579791 [Caerostris darwini]